MIVILAGVTMNALFAWLIFTFLAAKNGRQIDPVTTVGRVVDELVPPEAEAFKTIKPGARGSWRVNGRPVASWDDIVEGIANAPEPEIRLQLGRRLDGRRRRSTGRAGAAAQGVAGAAAVSRRRWSGQVAPGPPGRHAPGSSRATRSRPSTGRRSPSGTTCWSWCRRAPAGRSRSRWARAGGGASASTSRRTSTRSPAPTGSPRRSAGSAWRWPATSARSR